LLTHGARPGLDVPCYDAIVAIGIPISEASSDPNVGVGKAVAKKPIKYQTLTGVLALRAWLRDSGCSARSLCTMLGYSSPSAVSDILSGRDRPGLGPALILDVVTDRAVQPAMWLTPEECLGAFLARNRRRAEPEVIHVRRRVDGERIHKQLQRLEAGEMLAMQSPMPGERGSAAPRDGESWQAVGHYEIRLVAAGWKGRWSAMGEAPDGGWDAFTEEEGAPCLLHAQRPQRP